MRPSVDREALVVGMTLVPGLVSRNRSFALFEDPEVRRARSPRRPPARHRPPAHGHARPRRGLRRGGRRAAPASCATRLPGLRIERRAVLTDARVRVRGLPRRPGRGRRISRRTTRTEPASTRRFAAWPPDCSSRASTPCEASSAGVDSRDAFGRRASEQASLSGFGDGLEAPRVVVTGVVDVRAHRIGDELGAAGREKRLELDRSLRPGSSQRSHASGSSTSGIRSWMASTGGRAAWVRIAHDSTTSPSGETQRPQRPARANGRRSARRMKKGVLADFPSRLPLVEPVDRDEASPRAKRVAESARGRDRLDARERELVADLRVLGPRRDEPPAERLELAPAGGAQPRTTATGCDGGTL